MKEQKNHIDLPILISVLFLMVIGLGVVYSASSAWALEKYNESGRLLGIHAIRVLIGLVAIFTFMHIDYRHYQKLTKPFLVLCVVALFVTPLIGGEVKGAVRSLEIGGISIQPSEFAKYALIFHLAFLIRMKGEGIRDLKKGYIPLTIWIGLVTTLVFLQPNFSNGAMIAATGGIMLYMGRARWKHLLATAGVILPVMALYVVSAPYRMERVMSFFEWIKTLIGGEGDISYQLKQGILAFGNGGIFGLGPGQSRQRDFFLPESYGDFVYSIIGEEYGLIGSLFVMFLFLLILLRGLKVAKHSNERFGQLLAVGITSCIAMYALVNAGVTLGILPTTGLPMPFISYGGSSMIVSSVAIGVLLNISSHTALNPRRAKSAGSVRPLDPRQRAVGTVYS